MKLWPKLIVLGASALLVLVIKPTLKACADYVPNLMGISLQEAFTLPDWWPSLYDVNYSEHYWDSYLTDYSQFWYGYRTATQELYNYGSEYFMPDSDPSQDLMVQEWLAYLGKGYNADDIYHWVYHYSGVKSNNNTDAEKLQPGQDPSEQQSRLATLQKQLATKPEILAYMTFAEEVEKVLNPGGDPWGYEEDATDELSGSSPSQELLKTAEKQASQLTDKNPWLAQRYRYQTLVLNHYMGRHEQVKNLYAQWFEQGTKGGSLTPALALWAGGYVAKQLRKEGRIPEANVHFARLFMHCPSKRLWATRSFIGAEWLNAPAKCYRAGDDIAQLACYLAGQAGYCSATDLKTLVTLAPSAEVSTFIFTRELAKLEQSIGLSAVLPAAKTAPSEVSSFSELDRTQLKTVATLAAVLKGSNAAHQSRITRLRAMLALLNNDKATASQLLQADTSAPGSRMETIAYAQKRMMQMLLATIGKPTEQDAAHALELGMELMTLGNSLPPVQRMTEVAFEKASTALLVNGHKADATLLHLYITAHQEREHMAREFNLPAGANPGQIMAMAKSAAYWALPEYSLLRTRIMELSPEQVNEVKSAVVLGEKAMAKYFQTETPQMIWYLDEARSMHFLKNGKAKAALTCLKDIPDTYWSHTIFTTYLNEDPRYLTLSGPRLHTLPEGKTLSKPEVLEMLVELENQCAKNNYTNKVQLAQVANMYYNFSHLGNSWIMTQHRQSSNTYDLNVADVNKVIGNAVPWFNRMGTDWQHPNADWYNLTLNGKPLYSGKCDELVVQLPAQTHF